MLRKLSSIFSFKLEMQSHDEIKLALKKIDFDIKIIKELGACGMIYAQRKGY